MSEVSDVSTRAENMFANTTLDTSNSCTACGLKIKKKIIEPKPLEGLRIYLKRLSTFCRPTCGCGPFCKYSCQSDLKEVPADAKTYPKCRQPSQKLSFLDDPPYNVAVKPDTRYYAWHRDKLEWEYNCCWCGNVPKPIYNDVWHPKPIVTYDVVLRRFHPADDDTETCKSYINFRDSLPTWTRRRPII